MKKSLMLLISYFAVAFIYAQPVNYTVKVTEVRWDEGGLGAPCREVGSEEFRALVWFNDNLNPINIGGDCFTCGNNGDCTITPNTVIGGRSNTCAETIDIIFQGFENDDDPSCEANGGDDCRCGPEPVASINFRNAGPGCQTYGRFGCRPEHDVSVQICWSYSTPTNNNCTSPVTVNTGTRNFTLHEQCNGTDITSCTYNDYKSYWFRYNVPTYLRTLQIDTEGSSFNTGLSLFNTCGGSEVACDDNGGSGTLSRITLDCVSPSTTYYIRVSGWNGSHGAGKLNIIASPDNVVSPNSPVHAHIANGPNSSVAIQPCLRPIIE